MSYNLRYRRQKLKSRNFIPVIQFFPPPIEEVYTKPIEEFKEDPDPESESEEETLLLTCLIEELRKVKNIRKLELWITKNRTRVRELNDTDMQELLGFINDTFY